MNETEVWAGWGSVVLAVTICSLSLIIFAVIVWQAFKTWQTNLTTRANITREEDYRRLAEEATTTQRQLLDLQKRVAEDIVGLRERVGNIERVLLQVD